VTVWFLTQSDANPRFKKREAIDVNVIVQIPLSGTCKTIATHHSDDTAKK